MVELAAQGYDTVQCRSSYVSGTVHIPWQMPERTPDEDRRQRQLRAAEGS